MMRLMHPLFSEPIELRENQVTVIVVENPEAFAKMLASLLRQAEGDDGEFVLSEDFSPIEIKANMDVVTDLLMLTPNTKRLLSKLHAHLRVSADTVYFQQLQALQAQINGFMESLIALEDIAVTYKDEVEAQGILKLVDVSFEVDTMSLAARVAAYLRITASMGGMGIIAMVHLKALLGAGELEEIYRAAQKHNLRLVLFEATHRPPLHGENCLIIDGELCEMR